MDGAGANMCKAVNIDGVAVKASFISRVCVGGKDNYEVGIFASMGKNIFPKMQILVFQVLNHACKYTI